MSSPTQIKAIYALLGQYHLRDEKENIVSAFTGGRTHSVRAMKPNEATALIGHLKSMDGEEKSNDKMRNKILSMCHDMNWTIPGTGKVDMAHLNNWCMASGYLKKKLDSYTHSELPALVTQFEHVYKHHLTKV